MPLNREIIPLESAEAMQVFEYYWALGASRSLAKLADFLRTKSLARHTSIGTLQNWRARYHWEERIAQRQAVAALEIERLRRQAVADLESDLHKKGIAGLQLAWDRLFYLAEEGRMGATAAVEFARLSAQLSLRGLRQPDSISREEHVDVPPDQPLTVEQFLSLLPEELRSTIVANLAESLPLQLAPLAGPETNEPTDTGLSVESPPFCSENPPSNLVVQTGGNRRRDF